MTTTAPLLRPTDHTLAALLDDELDLDPVARGDFINHLAMSLVAVRRLGGSDDELQAWYDVQTSGDFLVRRERPEWLVPETEQVWSRGIATVVSEQLPGLIGSPGSQFFHAAIRLEHAVDAGHSGQVAHALHNWADHDHPLPSPPSGRGDASFRDVLRALASASGGAQDLPRRSHDLAAAPWFVASMERLRVHDGLLDEVSEAAIASHDEPRHFGTLHLVTGSRAAQALAPLLEPADRRELALRQAQAVAVTYVSMGAPPLAERRDDAVATPGDPTVWEPLGRCAIDSQDPHVAKLVYACRLEEVRTGNVRYREVATRQVG